MDIVNGEEWIGNLPDSLLVHILSSLETKDAFRTSVLSKRWTNHWTLVPRVSLIHNPDTCISCLDSDKSRCIDFENFVDRVILVYKLPHIDKFNLSYPDGLLEDNVSKVDTWISHLFNRPIRELSMDFSGNPCENHLNLSLGSFASDQLVSLSLMLEKVAFDLPSTVFFPKLKTCVISVTNPSVNFTKKLCFGCPILEELKLSVHIEECTNVTNLDFCSLTLKKFELTVQETRSNDHKIVLDTPVLEYLFISDDSLAIYDMKNVESLEEACIHVHDFYDDYYRRSHTARLQELLSGVSKVRSLRLPHLSLLELVWVDNYETFLGAITFMNVTYLELGVYCTTAMLTILARMPNLSHTKLSLFLGPCLYAVPVIPWGVAPRCLPPHLKVVEADLEDLGEYELKLLMYVLEKAMLLEKMIIQIDTDPSTEEKIIERQDRLMRLLLCPRASETCEIDFVC